MSFPFLKIKMDCCNTNKEEHVGDLEKMKGGKIKMERRMLLWIIIGVLFIAVLFLTFKAGTGGSSSTVIQSAGSVARSAASSSGMVGGC